MAETNSLWKVLLLHLPLWSIDSIDKLEVIRELCRNTHLWLGRSPHTECLYTMWVELTKVKVQIDGLDGSSVNEDGIGLPAFNYPVEHIKNMNHHQKEQFKKEVEIMIEVLPALTTMDFDLGDSVGSVTREWCPDQGGGGRFVKGGPFFQWQKMAKHGK